VACCMLAGAKPSGTQTDYREEETCDKNQALARGLEEEHEVDSQLAQKKNKHWRKPAPARNEQVKSRETNNQAAKRTNPHERENLAPKEKSLGAGYERPEAGLGKHARKALVAANKNQSREGLSPDAHRKEIVARQ
jgi:hypothetical protein